MASRSWGKTPAVVCVGLRIDSDVAVNASSDVVANLQAKMGTKTTIRPLARCGTDAIFGKVIDEENRGAWSIVYSDVDVVLDENKVAIPPEGRTWQQRDEFNRNRVIPPSPLLSDSKGQFDGIVELTDGFDTEWYYFDLRSGDDAVTIVSATRDRLIH
jgi:hypothetical protein